MKTKSFRIGTAWVLAMLVLAVAGAAIPAQAETPTDVYNFKGGTADVSGPQPFGYMVQGRDGNLYSVAPNGGANGNGGVFRVMPSGAETVIYSFTSSEGPGCQPGLTLGNDGNFYGVCYGNPADGILYKVTPTGTFTLLHAFTGGADGGQPEGPPIQASDGNFYGSTSIGGAQGQGTVYKLILGGTLTTLYSFTGGTDGSVPSGPFVQGTDGYLYGSTQLGGAHSAGTIFKITTAGKLTVLHAFDNTDGYRPTAAMIQGTDGNFYGTTYQGGANNDGVVFRMTTSGALRVLHSFLAATDGQNPEVAMVQATDGNFYGVANPNSGGGVTSLYKVTLKGVFSTLYLFDGTIGTHPAAPLLQNTDGLLYGDTTTGTGTGQSNGIFYSWNIGAPPFLRLALTSGKVGTLVGMFGQGFDSASVVKFGGVQAKTFTLTGTTYITATVPAGAIDGKVTVTTGTTTLTSSQTFIVHDSWSSGAAMPTARMGPFSGAIGTNIYVVGGFNSANMVGVNEIYNTVTNKWTTGVPAPTARWAGASAVVNGILYLIGGSDGSSIINLVEAYNPVTKAWSMKAPMPTARQGASAVVDKNIIYVIGGENSSSFLATVESYNTTTDTWTAEAPLLTAKGFSAAGLLGTTVVAADGENSSAYLEDNEGYNVSLNTWTTLPADPTPRTAGCFSAISGLLYVAGGDGTSGHLSLNEAYNPTKKSWATLAPMPNAVTYPGSAQVGGRLYSFGGGIYPSTAYNYVQIYQP